MVERKTLNLVVVGSIPTGGGLVFFFTLTLSDCITFHSKLVRGLNDLAWS